MTFERTVVQILGNIGVTGECGMTTGSGAFGVNYGFHIGIVGRIRAVAFRHVCALTHAEGQHQPGGKNNPFYFLHTYIVFSIKRLYAKKSMFKQAFRVIF
jgi:hypothetical protein